MHVLSTPPAFILSQDQTLMFNVDPSSRSTSFFILVITVLIKNVRWFFLKSSEKFIRIFKVVLLFSCQRSFLIRFLRVRSFVILSQFFLFVKNFLIYFVVLNSFVLQQLLYHIISDLVCQELFNFSFRSDLYCSDRSPSATFIDYHIWSLMSRSFSFFSESKMESDVIFFRRSFSDVDYLTIAVYSMSTTFFIFFRQWFCPSIYCVSIP